MTKALRHGKVLVDWSQNAAAKTTVAPYSLRARPEPTVSTPITWDEVAACQSPEELVFLPAAVLERVEADGDLLADLVTLTTKQRPKLPAAPRPRRRRLVTGNVRVSGYVRRSRRRMTVEVKIGVQYAAREIVVESSQTPEAVEALITAAVKAGGLLTLADERGRRVLVPVEKLAYVEIGEANERGSASARCKSVRPQADRPSAAIRRMWASVIRVNVRISSRVGARAGHPPDEQRDERLALCTHRLGLRECLADDAASPQREAPGDRRIGLDCLPHPLDRELGVAGVGQYLEHESARGGIEELRDLAIEVRSDAVTDVGLDETLGPIAWRGLA